MPDPKGPPPLTGAAAEQQLRRLTRRSFVRGAAAALAGLGAWQWLSTSASEDGVPWPLRRVLRFNERLAEGLGSPGGVAPTFPAEDLRGPARANGLVGLADTIVLAHLGGSTLPVELVERLGTEVLPRLSSD